MYTHFFGMDKHPFSIAPNPNFLYMSERHREALAHLSFAKGEQGGFILLTGEVGTGKTTVSRYLLRQMPENSDLAFILNPALSEVELLASVCDEFDLAYDKQSLTIKPLFDAISKFLLENHQQGRNTVLLIDEAQHLNTLSLERLRLLTNLETDSKKLLQVILIGQPELQLMLKQPNLRQLAQRITARYHLMPLNVNETKQYILHRLQVSGCQLPLFSRQAITAIYGGSGGIPRLINLICDRSLMLVYGLGLKQVNAQHVVKAAKEILGLEYNSKMKNRWLLPVFGAVAAILMFAVWLPPGKIFHFISGMETSIISSPKLQVEPPQKSLSLQEIQDSLNNDIARLDGNHLSDKTVVIHNDIEEQNVEKQNIESNLLDKQLKKLILVAQDRSFAFQNLFRIWGHELPLKDANCNAALSANLNCVTWMGNLNSLIFNNSPAVVEMLNENSRWFAVLYAVGDEVQLLLGDALVTVPKQWFNERWQGRYTLLWQPPSGYTGELMMGEKGKVVQWLESALAGYQQRNVRKLNRFDIKLKQDVKAFQQLMHLAEDGIAGVQTLIQLQHVTESNVPRLKKIISDKDVTANQAESPDQFSEHKFTLERN